MFRHIDREIEVLSLVRIFVFIVAVAGRGRRILRLQLCHSLLSHGIVVTSNVRAVVKSLAVRVKFVMPPGIANLL